VAHDRQVPAHSEPPAVAQAVLQALDGARIAAPEGAFPLLVVVEAAGVRALRLDLGDGIVDLDGNALSRLSLWMAGCPRGRGSGSGGRSCLHPLALPVAADPFAGLDAVPLDHPR
jgi:hypothetical protein